MSKTFRVSLIVIALVVGAAALLLTGLGAARVLWGIGTGWPAGMLGGYWGDPTAAGRFGRAGPGVMGLDAPWSSGIDGYSLGGPGMMGFGLTGPGMMWSGAFRPGMMGGGTIGATGLYDVEPLSLQQAEQALAEYLVALDNPDLRPGEIMIFDNHAYAQILEASTGVGAMEVLIDPLTLNVYPEHGPNMMWNLKYGPMAGYGLMGGMMGGYGGQAITPGRWRNERVAEMPIGPEQAIEAAQRYLDTYLPGTVADEHADPFYGYYTVHILRDGATAGMLSVNGYARQVFLHTWHGDFVEMSQPPD